MSSAASLDWRKSCANLLTLARVPNFAFPLVTLAVGYAVSGSRSDIAFLVLAVAVFLLHSGVNILNDLADYEIDAANGRGHIASIRTTDTYRFYLAAGIGLVAVSLVLSAFLPKLTFGLMALLALAAWIYNHKPVQASRRPVLSVAVLNLAGAWLPFLLGMSLGVISSAGLGLLAAWGLGRMSLTLLKDYKDALGDSQHQKRTFLLVFGGRAVAYWSLALAAIGWFGSLVLLVVIRGWHPALAVLGLYAMWLLWHRSLLLRRNTYSELHGVFTSAMRYQLLFDLVVLAWLIFS